MTFNHSFTLLALALLPMACRHQPAASTSLHPQLTGHWFSQPGWSTIVHEQNPHPAQPAEGLLELAIEGDSALWINNGFEQAALRLIPYQSDSMKLTGFQPDTCWLVWRSNKLYLDYGHETHVFEQQDTLGGKQSRMEWYLNNQFMAGTWRDTATDHKIRLSAEGNAEGIPSLTQYTICIGGDCMCNGTELVTFSGEHQEEKRYAWERRQDTLLLYQALLTTQPGEKPCYTKGKQEKVYVLRP